jgi:hypothetical protein
MIWVAGRSPTLVSQNLKATTLTYLAIFVQIAVVGFLTNTCKVIFQQVLVWDCLTQTVHRCISRAEP